MKHIQYIIIACLLISNIIITQAQNTVWGKYEVKLLEEHQKLQVTFSNLNDIFYVVPGNEEGAIVLGNDTYKVIYGTKEDKCYLVEVVAGEEYMSKGKINHQKDGFPYSDGQEGLNTVMQKFAILSDEAYHPPIKSFKSGWTDDKETHINYMELLGKGTAYYGSHDKEGNMDGIGTYIFADRETHTGQWVNNARNGEFMVRPNGDYEYKGEFVNNEYEGIWQKRKYKGYPDVGFIIEMEVVNGELKPTKEISKKQDKSLVSSMEKDQIYKSHRKEAKINGEWKRDFSLGSSLEYFEIYDSYNLYTQVNYMKTNAKKTSMEEEKARRINLIKIEEDDEKRVEYYSYSSSEEFIHTSPTITIYKKRKELTGSFNQDYNIVFYFPHEEGEYRYYFLLDEEEKEKIKQAQETHRLIEEGLKTTQDALKKLEETEGK